MAVARNLLFVMLCSKRVVCTNRDIPNRCRKANRLESVVGRLVPCNDGWRFHRLNRDRPARLAAGGGRDIAAWHGSATAGQGDLSGNCRPRRRSAAFKRREKLGRHVMLRFPSRSMLHTLASSLATFEAIPRQASAPNGGLTRRKAKARLASAKGC